jgi:serine/threonine-protein kinase
MATVHLGRLLGAAGFRRLVAVKRLHLHLAQDPYFRSMLIDEARLAARVHHPNVVGTIDAVAADGQLLVVMEYVHGESLSVLLGALQTRGDRVPLSIASAIVSDTLYGLHAAHEARDERGDPLGLVHRDVSPPNVLVGTDGVARVADFGIAKAAGRVQLTRAGQLKGKFAYMAPEQLAGEALDRRADIYAASAILWEMIVGRPIVVGQTEADVFREAMLGPIPSPRQIVPDVPAALEEALMRGLSRDPGDRYATAREMALALEAAMAPATAHRVGEWVEDIARDGLAERARGIAQFERVSVDPEPGTPASVDPPIPPPPVMSEHVAAIQRTAVSDKLPEGWPAPPPEPPLLLAAGWSAPPPDAATPAAPDLGECAPRECHAAPRLGPSASPEAQSLEREFLGLGDASAIERAGASEEPPEQDAPTVVRDRPPRPSARRESVAPGQPPKERAASAATRAAAPRRAPREGAHAFGRVRALWKSKLLPRIVGAAGALQATSPWRLMLGLALFALLVGSSPLVCMVATASKGDGQKPRAAPPHESPALSPDLPAVTATFGGPSPKPEPGAQDAEIKVESAPPPSLPPSSRVQAARPATPAGSDPHPAAHGGVPTPLVTGTPRRCDPPWTIGNDGIRHPKAECL